MASPTNLQGTDPQGADNTGTGNGSGSSQSGSKDQQAAGGISTAEPVRVDNRVRNSIIALVVVALLAVGAFFVFRAFSSSRPSAPKGSKDNPVVIGVVGANDPQWKVFQKEAQKQGIYVQLKNFTDYTSENPALAQGSLDLNEFQHILYLANYNVKNNQDLQPIGGVAVYPLGLYSSRYKNVGSIPQGAIVAIPNDETNQARAIGVLEGAGLIKLKGRWTAFTTPNDIDASASKVTVKAVEAAKVANALGDPSVSAGVVNNDYVKDAGLSPQDAIYHDSASSESAKPYINVWVSRKADANNAVYRKLVEIFHNDAVTKALKDHFGGQAVLNNDSPESLQKILREVQKQETGSAK